MQQGKIPIGMKFAWNGISHALHSLQGVKNPNNYKIHELQNYKIDKLVRRENSTAYRGALIHSFDWSNSSTHFRPLVFWRFQGV